MEKFNAVSRHQKHKTESRLVHQEGTILFLKSTSWISSVFMHFASLWVWHHHSSVLSFAASVCLSATTFFGCFSFYIVFIKKPDKCSSLIIAVLSDSQSRPMETHISLCINQKVFLKICQKWDKLKDQGEDLQLKPNRYMPVKYVFLKIWLRM